jgi:hypothetical protein
MWTSQNLIHVAAHMQVRLDHPSQTARSCWSAMRSSSADRLCAFLPCTPEPTLSLSWSAVKALEEQLAMAAQQSCTAHTVA